MPMAALKSPVRWITPARIEAEEISLQNELSIPRILAAVLIQRGFSDPAAAYKFLNPSLDHLHDPSLLPDYQEAIHEILGARERKEKIFVHGDYDVDGVTSAALYSRFLTKIGCDVHAHVPHRMKEGYGIHETAVLDAQATGAKLFLTCDCGISAHKQVALAKQLGMRVVVTDHHTVGEELPDAAAVVNPHRKGSKYPFPEISGAGVAFKLCEGLTRELGHSKEHYCRAYLDLAALGTIADVMPLLDENRVIAKFGLERIKDTKKVGLQALLRETELLDGPQPLTTRHVGWVLGPRLNAAGRIDDAALALRLLLETDEIQGALIARQIEQINSDRKTEQQKILDEAIEVVESEGLHERNVILVARPDWHPGVIGIVAGRLVEQFGRPAFVASIDPESGQCKGSARTIPGFNLAQAIHKHQHLLLSGGGHAMAAGFSVHVDQVAELAAALHEYAGSILTAEDFVITVQADLEVLCPEIDHASVEAISLMQPFGCENPAPTFLARGMSFVQVTPTKKPEHAQAILREGDGLAVNCVGFGLGERMAELPSGFEADVLFQPEIDTWNGNRRLKWVIKDFAAVPAISLR